jgi:hypothetical protein
LLARISTPVRSTVVAANATSNVQDAPAASVAQVLFVIGHSAGAPPPAAATVIEPVTVDPTFVTVKRVAALVLPAAVVKAAVVGVRVSCELARPARAVLIVVPATTWRVPVRSTFVGSACVGVRTTLMTQLSIGMRPRLPLVGQVVDEMLYRGAATRP